MKIIQVSDLYFRSDEIAAVTSVQFDGQTSTFGFVICLINGRNFAISIPKGSVQATRESLEKALLEFKNVRMKFITDWVEGEG